MTVQMASAIAILVATWLGLRWEAQALRPRLAPPWVMALDLAPIAMGWAVFLALTVRPVLASVIIASIGSGLALADGVKRHVLREPVVFADRAELLEVVRHPQLYLPFAGTGRVIGGAVAAFAAAVAFLTLEPPMFHWSPLRAAVAGLAAIAAFLLPLPQRLVKTLGAQLERLHASGDPERDAQHFGLLACLIIHATIARAERPSRQRAAGERSTLNGAAVVRAAELGAVCRPIVMVQLESFFDARRLHAELEADLPGLDACRSSCALYGDLRVPCWGANTIRTEHAVLTGLAEADLGLDRFNPSERFVQGGGPSLVRQLQQAGYQTICLHPFDKRFYARDRVMPALGFDRFIGPEGFPSTSGDGSYTDDAAVARVVAELVRREGPAIFVFAIMIGNHGPWRSAPPEIVAHALPGWLQASPEAGAFVSYLNGLRETDKCLPILMNAVLPLQGLLAVYGDHQPSFPDLFKRLGHTSTAVEYVLWQNGSGLREPLALAAHELAKHVLTYAARSRLSATRATASVVL